MNKTMQTKNAQLRIRSKALRRFGILALLALMAASAVAAISKVGSGSVAPVVKAKEPATPDAHYAALEWARRNLQTNALSLQQRPLTQDEARQLAEAIKEMTKPTTDGLKSVRHADGTVSMDLEDHFQNVVLARKNEDGSVEQACVDNPKAAAEFLRIDPTLVGERPSTVTTKPTAKPVQ